MGRAKRNPSLADQENDGFRFAPPILRMTDARHAQERRYEHASCIPQPAAFFRACFRGAAAFFARPDSSCPFFRTSNRPVDRTSVGSGKSGAVRVDIGGRRTIKKK